MLYEWSMREKDYVSLINKQKEELFEVTSKFADTMDRHKKELLTFVKQNSLAATNADKYQNLLRLTAKIPPNKFNKIEFAPSPLNGGHSFDDSVLSCSIKFLYMTFLFEDYICENVPRNMAIRLKQYYPHRKNCDLQFAIDPRISEDEIQECVKNCYPIEIYTKCTCVP